jgi:hypothetical protein
MGAFSLSKTVFSKVGNQDAGQYDLPMLSSFWEHTGPLLAN